MSDLSSNEIRMLRLIKLCASPNNILNITHGNPRTFLDDINLPGDEANRVFSSLCARGYIRFVRWKRKIYLTEKYLKS